MSGKFNEVKAKIEAEQTDKGLSRRDFIRIAGMGALSCPLMIEPAQAEDLAPGTFKTVAQVLAGVEMDDQEAKGYAPIVDSLSGAIRGVEVSEELEPMTVFSRKRGVIE